MLLVEDEEKLAALMARGLTERGDVVDVVGTAAEALTSARGGEYDVILLDIRLPDRDGFEVLPPAARGASMDTGPDADRPYGGRGPHRRPGQRCR